MQTKIINIDDFKIEVSSKHKGKLAKKNNCTTQFVRMALEYRTNSKKAKNIRLEARALLQQEINKIDSIKIGEE